MPDYVVKILIQLRENVAKGLGGVNRELAKTQREAKKTDRDFNDLDDSLRKISRSTDSVTARLARLSGALRGFMMIAVGMSLQGLISSVTALGTQLVAVVASAIQAGAALGGALVAGIAQAVPAIGVLIASFQRLGAVMEAAKAQDKAQQASAEEGAAAADSQRSATDALANAQRNLTKSHEAVADATKNLTQARRDARRELTDMMHAERAAELQFSGSQKSYEEAVANLRNAIETGGDVAQAQLDLEGARLDRDQARVAANRARVDNARTQGRGIERAPGVVAARRGLDDARWNESQAVKALANAERGLSKAMQNSGSAASQLEEQLKKLSKSERRLYEDVVKLRDEWRKRSRGFTDPIIDSMDRTVNRLRRMLSGETIMGPLKELSKEIAGIFDEISDRALTGEGLENNARIVTQAAESARLLKQPLADLYTGLQKIAISGDSVFKRLIERFGNFADRLANRDQATYDRFFGTARRHLDGWLDMLSAAGRLIGALMGASSNSNLTLMENFADAMDRATKWIRENPEKVEKFFDDTRKSLEVIAGLIFELGKAMVETFDPETVEALANILKETVIPAFETAVRVSGHFLRILEKILDIPIIGDMAKLGLEMVALGVIFGRLAGVIAAPFKLAAAAVKLLLERLALLKAFDWMGGGKGGRGPGPTGGGRGGRGPGGPVFLPDDYIDWEDVGKDGKPKGGGKKPSRWGRAKEFGKNAGKLSRFARVGGALTAMYVGYEVAAYAADGDVDDPRVRRLNSQAPTPAPVPGSVPVTPTYSTRRQASAPRSRAQRLVSAQDVQGLKDFTKELTRLEKGKELDEISKKISKWGKEAGVPAAKIRELRRAMRDTQGELADKNKSVDKALENSKRNFEDWAKTGSNNLRGISMATAENMEAIRKTMGSKSAAATAALAGNYDEAVKAVQRAMREKKVTERDGLNYIVKLNRDKAKLIADMFKRELKERWGLSDQQVKDYQRSGGKNSGNYTGGMGAASGWIGYRGERGMDNVGIQVGRGEAVINAPHQSYIEPALQSFYGHGLGTMFKRVRGYHAGNAMNQPVTMGFARGGRVTGDTDYGRPMARALEALAKATGRDIYVQDGGRTIADQKQRVADHGLYNAVTNPTGAAAPNPNAPHVLGIAADITPGREVFGGVAGRFGLSFPVPQESWHIQLVSGATSGPIGGGGDEGSSTSTENVRKKLRKLKDLEINVGGYWGALTKANVSGLRRVANARIKKLNDTARGGVDGANYSGGGSNSANMKLGRQMLLDAGFPASEWPALKKLWTGESGWNHLAVNKSSGAYGIPQSLPASKLASAGADWRTNPATQIEWGLKYIKERYGSPSRALAFWNSKSPHWYAEGGVVPGRRGEGMPALLHGDEWILDAPQQHRLSKLMGAGVGHVKGMLGLNRPKSSSSFAGGGAADRVTSSQLLRGTQIKSWDKFLDAIEKLTKLVSNSGNAGKAVTRLNKLFGENGRFAKLQEKIEEAVGKAQVRLTRANFSAKGGVFRRTMTDQQRVQAELDISLGERGMLVAQKAELEGSRSAISSQIKKAVADSKKKGIKKKDKQKLEKQIETLRGRYNEAGSALDGLSASIADNMQSIVEQQEAVQQAAVDAADRRASRKTSRIDVMQRMRNALGDKSMDETFIDARIAAARDQAAELSFAMSSAMSTGNTELAEGLQDRIDDLNASIVEMAASKLTAAREAVDAESQRASSYNDIRQSFAQIGRTNFGELGNALVERTGILESEIRSKEALLGRAYAEGNVGESKLLEDELARLRLAVAQNKQAVEDNTDAAQADRIDRISQRASFGTGMFGGLQGLVQGIANLTGIDTDAMQASFLQRSTGTLTTARKGYADELLSQFGIDVRGLSGLGLANVLGNLDMASITTNMSDPDRQRFENLINSLISNETAITSNTQALDDLNSVNKDQGFASTAWQMYRLPIFNGMGQMVPSMRVAGAASGAMVMSSGLLQVHSGERVVPADIARERGGSGVDLHLTVNEAGRVPDAAQLAGDMMFHLRNAR